MLLSSIIPLEEQHRARGTTVVLPNIEPDGGHQNRAGRLSRPAFGIRPPEQDPKDLSLPVALLHNVQ